MAEAQKGTFAVKVRAILVLFVACCATLSTCPWLSTESVSHRCCTTLCASYLGSSTCWVSPITGIPSVLLAKLDCLLYVSALPFPITGAKALLSVSLTARHRTA